MVVVGGAHGRAKGQRTLSSFPGSFSQPKVELRHLAQLTCQATSMRWAGKRRGCNITDRTHRKNPEKIM